MIIRPLYKKETLVAQRRLQLPVLICVINIILAILTITEINIEIINSYFALEIDYEAFFSIFKFINLCEYLMISIVTINYAASCISLEYEKNNLDLLLLTKLSTKDIIRGKLFFILGNVMAILISSMPIIALSFIYSSISISDVILIIFSYFIGMLFMASVGIFISALVKKTAISNVISYIFLLLILVIKGGFISGLNLNKYLYFKHSAINFLDIIGSINPINIFLISVNKLFGHYDVLVNNISNITDISDSIVAMIFFVTGNVFYILVSLLLLYKASLFIDPKR